MLSYQCKITCTLLAALLFLGIKASAYDLRNIPTLVERNNKDYLAAKLDFAAADEEVLAARARYFPKIEVTTTYTHLNDSLEIMPGAIKKDLPLPACLRAALHMDSLPIELQPDSIEIQSQDFWKSSLSATQPLFAGGRIIAANHAAQAKEVELIAEAERIRRDMIGRVLILYFQIQLSEQIEKVLSDIRANLVQLHLLTQQLVITGVAPKFNLNQILVAQSDVDAKISEVKGKTQIAREALRTVLFLPAAKDFLFSQPLLKLPLPADERGFQQQALVERKEFAKKSLTAFEPRWAVGAGVTLSLTAGLAQFPQVWKTENLLLKVNTLKEKATREIPMQIKNLFLQAQAQSAAMTAVAECIKQAQEAHRLADVRFAAGEGALIEVMSTSNDLERIRIKQWELLEAYNRNIIELSMARGNPQEYIDFYERNAK